MVPAAGLVGETEITLNLAPLALAADAPVPVGAGPGAVMDAAAVQQGIVLAVGGDQLAERPAALHGLAHHPRILHAVPVIGKGADQRGKTFEVRKLLPLFVHADGAVGKDRHDGVPGDPLPLRPELFRAVRHGVQVRHCADCRITAVSGGETAAENRLFIRKTRLAKVHMHIAEAGKENIFT